MTASANLSSSTVAQKWSYSLSIELRGRHEHAGVADDLGDRGVSIATTETPQAIASAIVSPKPSADVETYRSAALYRTFRDSRERPGRCHGHPSG